MMMPIVETASKNLEKRLNEQEIKERIETIQTTAQLKINKFTKKCPVDQRRFAVTQTSLKNHRLNMVWKTPKE